MAKHLEAGSFWQHEVKQHQVGMTGIEVIDSFVAVTCLDHFKPVMGEITRQHLAHHWLVIDDQNQL